MHRASGVRSTSDVRVGDRRIDPRFRQHRLHCREGEIVDISTTGVRLFHTRPIKAEATIELHAKNGERFTIGAHVVWRKRLGFRKHVAGLAFNDLTDDGERSLREFLSLARIDRKPARDASTRLGAPILGGIGFALLIAGAALNYFIAPNTIAVLALVGVGLLLAMLSMAMLSMGVAGAPPRERSDAVDRRSPGKAGSTAAQILNSVLESSVDSVLVLSTMRDRDAKVHDFACERMNSAAEHLFGWSSAALTGQSYRNFLTLLDELELFAVLVNVVETGLPETVQRFAKSTHRWFQVSIAKCGDGVTLSMRDISQEKAHQQRLQFDALHDALTGLPNRKAVEEAVDRAVYRAQNDHSYRFAVMFLDFDGFKQVNDTLGHEVGDLLLMGIADRLRNCVGGGEVGMRMHFGHVCGRLGGDEFVVLLQSIGQRAEVESLAERMLTVFSEPHVLNGHEVVSTASIGVAFFHEGHTETEHIMRDADAAMYRAKSAGKARYAIAGEDEDVTYPMRDAG